MKTIQDHIDDDKKELEQNGINPQRRRHLQNEISELESQLQLQGESSMANTQHDLDHEVYIDPKDHKEHINHGMLEYKKSELEEVHADYETYHKDDVVEPNEGKINDWHTRHEDKHLEIYCDNHPDAFECRVYDD